MKRDFIKSFLRIGAFGHWEVQPFRSSTTFLKKSNPISIKPPTNYANPSSAGHFKLMVVILLKKAPYRRIKCNERKRKTKFS